MVRKQAAQHDLSKLIAEADSETTEEIPMHRNQLNIVGVTAFTFGIVGFFVGVKFQESRTPMPTSTVMPDASLRSVALPPQPVEQVPIQDPASGRTGRIAGIDAPIDTYHPQGTVYPP